MSLNKSSCCQIRSKVVLLLGPILTEEQCGVPDSILADFMRFDLNGPPRSDGREGTKGVLGVRYCSWCGTKFGDNSEIRISEIRLDQNNEGEEWKNR